MTSMRSEPSPAQRAFGARIAAARRARGLSGQALGDLCEWSQSKISRIENGITLPSIEDVEALIRVLEIDEEEGESLLSAAHSLHGAVEDVRRPDKRLDSFQIDYARHEARASAIRIFQVGVVPGLLQTDDYARYILSSYAHVVGNFEPYDVAQAVSHRVSRQEILYDASKRFIILLLDSIFRYPACPPQIMLAQVERIRDVAKLPNVTVGIVPPWTTLTPPPAHGVEILDDSIAMIDLSNTSLFARADGDIRLYRRIFDAYERAVTDGPEGQLDEYAAKYLAQLRPIIQPPPGQ